MLYSKEFIASIKGAPASGVVKACAMAFEKLGAKGTWDEESYNVLSEAYALVASVIEAGLIDGLGDYIPRLTLDKVPGASHWIIHEQPERVIAGLQAHLLRNE